MAILVSIARFCYDVKITLGLKFNVFRIIPKSALFCNPVCVKPILYHPVYTLSAFHLLIPCLININLNELFGAVKNDNAFITDLLQR